MNVLIISQCQKNALKETRRILDQFAERKGERTWQTAITQAGLVTLRKLLRQKARRNTAVACHWIRGLDHSELLWVVGDATRFDERGTVPTNMTRRDIVRREDEDHWHSLGQIHWLASMAALFHDLGKATEAFQKRLRTPAKERNRYRHEWVSLRLLEAFVGKDDDARWIERLASPAGQQPDAWLSGLKRDGVDPLEGDALTPFRTLPPLAAAIGWLIVTHHRMPLMPSFSNDSKEQDWLGKESLGWEDQLARGLHNVTAYWNELKSADDDLSVWWHFPYGLPVTAPEWHARARRLSGQLQKATWWSSGASDPLSSPYVMHMARLCLMMADHHYSSLNKGMDARFKKNVLYANTMLDPKAWPDSRRMPNQTLIDHLLGVTRCTGEAAHRLPSLAKGLRGITHHRPFRKRSRSTRFRWQDRAFDLASSLQERSQLQGFFGVNMASTGCGKTLANGRIMYALAHPRRGARFTIALGLRTLTLQTGNAYRHHLKLNEDDLAVRVGGSAQMALYRHANARQEHESPSGSSSDEALIGDGSRIELADRLDPPPLLRTFIHDTHAHQFISAPIMTCTIDHLMPATESTRGGHQIAPMLRLMTSDLVLDEPDDFDINDLPALTRLVYWAGLCGSRVMLSSATLPPFMVRGLFEAYREGRQHYQQHQGDPAARDAICCAWFDEQHCDAGDCASPKDFKARHEAFAARRSAYLADTSMCPTLRAGEIMPIRAAEHEGDALHGAVAEQLMAKALALHQDHHGTSPDGQRVSFGLIRLANINPLVGVARQLFAHEAPEGVRIHLCVYHSQFPLLMRSRKEEMLDAVLDRHDTNAVYQHPSVAPWLAEAPNAQHIFIVLGSPVTEVGRDHDYDWAIVEPSSIRSIIQLAGRVQRHRQHPPTTPNIALMNLNIRALKDARMPAFSQPGFESNPPWKMVHHSLDQGLLPEGFLAQIDARPRLERPDFYFEKGKKGTKTLLAEKDNLSVLEHKRIGNLMMSEVHESFSNRYAQPSAGAFSIHQHPHTFLTGLLPQHQPFRRQTSHQAECIFLPNEAHAECVSFHRVQDDYDQTIGVSSEYLLERVELETSYSVTPWGDDDYLQATVELAESMDISIEECAWRFGRLTLRDVEKAEVPGKWAYHPVLGVSRYGA